MTPQKKPLLQTVILGMFLFLSLSCGQNTYVDMAIKDSEDAVFEDALKLINRQEYAAAISKIQSLPTSYQANTEVREALAGAYAGHCGMHFIQLVTQLGETSSRTVFSQLMNVYRTNSSPPLASCLQAESLMKSFGNASVRTADQNFFMLIYGFAKIGLYLRSLADTDQDGTKDAGLNICDSNSLSDNNVKELFTGMGLILENFAGVTSQIANANAGTGITSISTLCTTLGTSCAITETTSVDGTMVGAMRDILNSDSIGIGSCNLTGVAMAGCCP